PMPIVLIDKPGAKPSEMADGAALWTKAKSDITAADYTDFYRSIAGQFDEPALTIHFRAERGYTTLGFIPTSRPFDLFDPHRKGRIKLKARLHHRRGGDLTALFAVRTGTCGFHRFATQRFTRKDPGKPHPLRRQDGRDGPRARRAGEARREGARILCQDLGSLRYRA